MSNKWEKELMRRLKTLYFIAKQNGRMFPEHDLNHAQRVKNLCFFIDEKDSLNLDKEILIASAFLHDIGYILDDSPEHVKSSIRFAKTLLLKIKFPKNKIASVIVCIKNHDAVPGRLGWKEEVPMECSVLRDADAIESIGCLGIIRYASWGGRHQMPIYNQTQLVDDKNNIFPNIDLMKNIKIRTPELIMRCCTKTGMIIIQKRLKEMQKFISEIEKEINFAENLGGK